MTSRTTPPVSRRVAALAMATPEPITRRKLSDEVFERLIGLLENGGLQPGDLVPSERELMTQFGVGRPAIREAMQTLERMGLIVISHGERARVVPLTAASLIAQLDRSARHLLATSPQSLEHLKEAREFFEIGMVRQATLHHEAADIARLEAALLRQTDAMAVNWEAFIAADMAFHTTIAAITRNPVFEGASRAMLGWLSRFHAGLLYWRGHEQITLGEHREILDQIAARDVDGAVRAMQTHLRRTRSVYRTTQNVVEDKPPPPKRARSRSP
jgi:GntR family transcriptional regulator, sialic acid-inducible nan operon repressor